MKFYWFKIALGAVGIFAAGMVIRAMVRSAHDTVQNIADGTDPITIPLPFGIMPFNLEGHRLGSVERLVLLRDAPKSISGIRIRVKLADSIASDRLTNCLLVVDDPQDIDEHTSFRCQAADTAGLALVQYGSVDLEGLNTELPLLIPASAVAELRSESGSAQLEADADSIARAAEAWADSISEVADSITEANIQMADSIREDARHRADSIRQAAMELADSIRRVRSAPRPSSRN